METLSRKQNLTVTEPTMTLEFCPLLLLGEGNGVIICNYSLENTFIVLLVMGQKNRYRIVFTHTHTQLQKNVPCSFVSETYHLILTNFGFFIKFCPPKLILLGNKEIALLNRANSTNFIVLFLPYVLKMASEVSHLSSVRLESVLIFFFF